MNTAEPAKLLADCCAAGPIDLIIERVDDGTVVARGSLDQPFALIGRDPYCDIHLNDPEVALRHAFAQVIGGHVFIVDLASPMGIHWNGDRQTSGWLNPGEPIRIGPFNLFLTRSAATHPTVLDADFHPLTTTSDGTTTVVLEFRTGLVARSAWEVNRVLTLIGRASECKFNLGGDDIAMFHGYLLKTIAGLWVIDLRARAGVFVNGQKVRVALLQENDVLRIGKFEIGIKYPKIKSILCSDSVVDFGVPEIDPASHERISSDSARIGPPQPTMQAPDGALPIRDDLPELTPAPKPLAPAMLPVGGLAVNLMPMLQQMGEMQAAMYSQFQQSLAMLMQLVSQMEPGSDVAKMAALSNELFELQKAAVVPMEVPMGLTTPAPMSKLPDPMNVPPMTEQSARQHEDLFDRMTKLHDERQTLWKRFLKR
ncbi:hypothetical protein BH11PLA2_BH11PLA2_20650 [soil metagenome]